jgi:hypothetical protein
MATTKSSAIRRTEHPETLSGDARQRMRAALFAAVLSDACTECGATDAGFGDEGELCEGCAAELGAL